MAPTSRPCRVNTVTLSGASDAEERRTARWISIVVETPRERAAHLDARPAGGVLTTAGGVHKLLPDREFRGVHIRQSAAVSGGGRGPGRQYLFDNCLEDPNQPIEVLANDDLFRQYHQVRQPERRCPRSTWWDTASLIARAYLTGLQLNGTYLAPTPTLVRKLVLLASPNFGSFVLASTAATIPTGTQSAEVIPGSSLLWNLASWNQHGDGCTARTRSRSSGMPVPTRRALLRRGPAERQHWAGLLDQRVAQFVSSTALTNSALLPHGPRTSFTSDLQLQRHEDREYPQRVSPNQPDHRSFLAGTADWQSIGSTPQTPISRTMGAALRLQGRYLRPM